MEHVEQRSRRDRDELQGAGDRTGSLTFTFLTVAVVLIGPLSFGYALGYTSPTEAQIASTQIFQRSEMSVFEALVNVGAMVGAAASGWLSDTLGRKGAISVACYPFIAGWVAIMYGASASVLLLGRFLTGVGVGVISQAVPVFIAEVAPPSLRGTLGSTNQLAVTFGILLVYLLGLESIGLSWRELAFAALCPLLVLLLATFFIPESPRWLCANNKKEAAAAALRVLRGTDNVHAELRDIHAAALEAAALPAATPSDFFQRRSVAGPLGVSLSLMAFQQFTGINAVIFNATGIFANAGVQSAGIAALCVAVLQVVVTAVSVLLMDLAGRRPLLLAASVGMCASSVALGIALKEQAGMVAVGAVLTYIAAFSIGMGPIPWLIMSEILPAFVRGTASSLATLTNWSCAFIVTLTFARMNAEMGASNTFFLYATVSAAAAVFVFAMLPETKGRTLEEIGALFEDDSGAAARTPRGAGGGGPGGLAAPSSDGALSSSGAAGSGSGAVRREGSSGHREGSVSAASMVTPLLQTPGGPPPPPVGGVGSGEAV